MVGGRLTIGERCKPGVQKRQAADKRERIGERGCSRAREADLICMERSDVSGAQTAATSSFIALLAGWEAAADGLNPLTVR
jgi:hypothetical protein